MVSANGRIIMQTPTEAELRADQLWKDWADAEEPKEQGRLGRAIDAKYGEGILADLINGELDHSCSE